MNTSRRGFFAAVLAVAASPKFACAVSMDRFVSELTANDIKVDSEQYTIQSWLQISHDDTNFSRRLPTHIRPDTWHHFTTVNNGAEIKHYVDGIGINSDSLTDGLFAELHLCSWLQSNQRNPDVKVHEFRVTNAIRDIVPR